VKTLAEVPVGDGLATFEIEEMSGVGPEQVSRSGDRLVTRLNRSLSETLEEAAPAAQAVLDAFRALAPDEVGVEFGLELDAEAGVVFTKGSVGAHFTIQLKWSRQPAV
jgi:NTP-dependent ternary system trypsin peptidase co-occuring protein